MLPWWQTDKSLTFPRSQSITCTFFSDRRRAQIFLIRTGLSPQFLLFKKKLTWECVPRLSIYFCQHWITGETFLVSVTNSIRTLIMWNLALTGSRRIFFLNQIQVITMHKTRTTVPPNNIFQGGNHFMKLFKLKNSSNNKNK